MNTHERIEMLQSVPIFGGLNHSALSYMLESSNLILCQTGEYFFHEGDQASSMFVLETGQAHVLKQYKNKTLCLHELNKNDCFGEMALMDMTPRSASVIAFTTAHAIELTCTMIYGLYRRDPEQFTMLQMNMGREVSRRLRKADQALFESAQQSDKTGLSFKD